MHDDLTLEEHGYKGYNIKFIQDVNPESPREWDNLGTMVCFHDRYDLLGDKHDFTPKSIQRHTKRSDVVALPLYLLDHSGLSLQIEPFRGEIAYWDSGQVGFIYMTYKAIWKVYGKGRVDKKLERNQALTILKGEVETYDQYLRGEAYGYIVEDPDGEHVDSCWGFYGYEYSEHLPEIKALIDDELAEVAKKNAQAYKEERELWIMNDEGLSLWAENEEVTI